MADINILVHHLVAFRLANEIFKKEKKTSKKLAKCNGYSSYIVDKMRITIQIKDESIVNFSKGGIKNQVYLCCIQVYTKGLRTRCNGCV